MRIIINLTLAICAAIVGLCITSHALATTCPSMNKITDNTQWQCHPGGPVACQDGDAPFIGASLRDLSGRDEDHFIRYVCHYDERKAYGGSIIHLVPPKKFESDELYGRWLTGRGYIKLYCLSDDPNDCPIPAMAE